MLYGSVIVPEFSETLNIYLTSVRATMTVMPSDSLIKPIVSVTDRQSSSPGTLCSFSPMTNESKNSL